MTSARGLSRRSLLGLFGGGVAAAGATGVGGFALAADRGDGQKHDVVAFHGAHQAGISTPVQDRLHFAAFDVTTTEHAELVAMLATWTSAAEQMCAGEDVGLGGTAGGPAQAPPSDTGEAYGLRPSRLTLTIGFGPSLFTDAQGTDRFGIADRRPAALADLPPFPGDALDPARSGGDICIQACADDPQVAVHAIRNLARLARGTASVRWSQLGFGRTSTTSTTQSTPRNLMGFKDGTANLKAEDGVALDRSVWVARGDGPEWMTGGSYLVARRIRMLIEPWDSTPLAEQERVIGRAKGSGAPLGRSHEFDEVDFAAPGTHGGPAIDVKSHVRLAHPTNNGGAELLRRGYSFTDGTDGLGRLDAGLFFLAYQRDPRTQFVRIQKSLAGKQNDALNEYLQHVGSGLFACPPGVAAGQSWGATLLA